MSNCLKYRKLQEILFAILILAIPVIIFSFTTWLSWEGVENNNAYHAVVENTSSDGTAKIRKDYEWTANGLKARIENLHLKNIKKVSVRKSGDHYEVIVEFRERQ